MFLGLAAILLILTVPLLGGRLGRLADVQVKAIPLLLAALLVQILVTVTFTSAPVALLAGLHIASYAAAAWVLFVNRRMPGMWVIAAGAALNTLAIVVNRGTLPASQSAEQAAGVDVTTRFTNSGVLHHPHLAFLGDTMHSPSWLPFQNVVSIGDLVILSGFALLVHAVCESRIGEWRATALRGVTSRVRLAAVRG